MLINTYDKTNIFIISIFIYDKTNMFIHKYYSFMRLTLSLSNIDLA